MLEKHGRIYPAEGGTPEEVAVALFPASDLPMSDSYQCLRAMKT